MSRTIAGSFKAVSYLLAGAAALGLAGGAAAAPGAEVTGAVTMFIKYRTEPWTRPAFRKHLAGSAVPQFAKWKEEGVLKDYLLLYNLYLNLDVWDAMAVIDFGDTAQVQKWKEVERRSPGGLSPEGLTLGWPTSTQWADRTWFGSQETGDRAQA